MDAAQYRALARKVFSRTIVGMPPSGISDFTLLFFKDRISPFCIHERSMSRRWKYNITHCGP